MALAKVSLHCILNNVDMLSELPFYNELIIVKQQKHLKDMSEVIALK